MTSRISNKSKMAQLKGIAFGNRKAIVATAFLVIAGTASAQVAGTSGLCAIASWIKSIAGVVALLAVLILAINNMFGKNEMIGELVMKVGMTCAFIGGGTYFIQSFGLQTCAL